MAIMGVVHISQYLDDDDDHTVAASSYDHFASCGAVVSFAGANVDNGNKGGGKGMGQQRGQPAIKPPAPTLAIKDDPNPRGPGKGTNAKKELCSRYNTKNCPGGAKKGKCPVADRWHSCSSCGGNHPAADCTTGTPLSKTQQRKRKRQGKDK